MNRYPRIFATFIVYIFVFCLPLGSRSQPAGPNLKIIFIRHAEKPLQGDNLTCKGLNRSLLLPAMIKSRFGIPDLVYVPSLGLGDSTKHARMFETAIPLASKYNLIVNSRFAEKDYTAMANDLRTRRGTVLVVWEHKAIPFLVRALGIENQEMIWPDDDYESIWIVTFSESRARITREKQELQPAEACPF